MDTPGDHNDISSSKREFSDFIESRIAEAAGSDSDSRYSGSESAVGGKLGRAEKSPSLIGDLLFPLSIFLSSLKSVCSRIFVSQSGNGGLARFLTLVVALTFLATLFVLALQLGSIPDKSDDKNGTDTSSKGRYVDADGNGIADIFEKPDAVSRSHFPNRFGNRPQKASESTRDSPSAKTELSIDKPAISRSNSTAKAVSVPSASMATTAGALHFVDEYISLSATEREVSEAEKFLSFPIDYFDAGSISREKWRSIHSEYLNDTFDKGFFRVGNAQFKVTKTFSPQGEYWTFSIFTVIAGNVSSIRSGVRSELVIAKEYVVRFSNGYYSIISDKQLHRQKLSESNLSLKGFISEGVVWAHDGTGFVNLRRGPSVDSPIIKELPNGTKIRFVRNRNSDWWFAVTYDQEIGLIFSTGIE